MNIKIEYFSSERHTWFVQSSQLPELLSLVHKIQRLMVGNECFLLNRADLFSIAGTDTALNSFASGNDFESWTAIIQIAGARRRPAERIAYQEKVLHEICAEVHLKPRRTLPESGTDAESLQKHLQQPWPQDKPYWKYRRCGGCHDIAFHTTYENMAIALSEVDSVLSSQDQRTADCGLYIQPLEYGRAYYCCLHLYYDPASESQKANMLALDHDINRRLMHTGGLFNTPYGNQVDLAYDHAAMVTDTLKKVKDIFDPAGIMNPGKLCF